MYVSSSSIYYPFNLLMHSFLVFSIVLNTQLLERSESDMFIDYTVLKLPYQLGNVLPMYAFLDWPTYFISTRNFKFMKFGK